MNLQSEITEVRRLIGEPYRDDSSDYFVTDEEICEWIYQGELALVRDLNYQALFSLQSTSSVTTVPGQESYDLISDYVRILGGKFDPYNGSNPMLECRLVDPGTFHAVKHNPQFNRLSRYDKPYMTIIDNKFYLYPAPLTAAIGGFVPRYIKRPTRRRLFWRFRVTVASTSSIESGATGTKANVSYTNAWLGCQMRNVSDGSSLWGMEREVTSSSPTSGAFGFTTVWSAAPLAGDLMEVGEVSELPEDLYPLWLAWATYMAMMKDRSQEAAGYLAKYQKGVADVNARWGIPQPETLTMKEAEK